MNSLIRRFVSWVCQPQVVNGVIPRGAVSLGALTCAMLVGLAGAPAASAAGLGRLTVHSALGQALDADIEVPAVDRDEAASLQIRLASAAAFKQANLEFNPLLNQVRLEILPGNGSSYSVHLSSAQAVNEPYLDVLLELTWAGGRVLREYTLLLDPPGLQQAAPNIVAAGANPPAAQPVTEPAGAANATGAATPVAPAPQSAPAPEPKPVVPSPAPRADVQPAPAPVAKTAPSSVRVKPGDTLGQIASGKKPSGVSLDQMLVALLHANPQAFVDNNMNRLKSGADLSIPDSPTVAALDARESHAEVLAQSNDFAQYRNRLAQAVQSSTPTVSETPRAASGGKITPKVDDRSSAPAGDQLKIARADSAKAPAAAAAAARDEQLARERALAEQKQRAAALEKANADLKRASDLAAKKAAADKAAADKAAAEKAAADQRAAEKAASEKAAADKRAADEAAAAAKRAAEQAAADKAAADKAAAQKLAADKAAADKAAADKAAATPAAAPTVVGPVASGKKPPAAPEPTLIDRLLSLPVMGTIGGVLALVLIGLNVSRRRREASQSFSEDPIAANSLFGTVGGQSVDTSATSTFNSSFIPAASQLDSNEVDPVAEADVYIAYGREEQAEEILKESLRLQPERIPVRIKLLEIYARRNDPVTFKALAEVLHEQTAGSGEEWERVAKMGRSLDPSDGLYSGVDATTGVDAVAPAADPEGAMGSLSATIPGEMEDDSLSQMLNSQGASPVSELNSGLLPETAIPFDSEIAAEPVVDLTAPVVPEVKSEPSLDFAGLDFDLGSSKLNLDTPTQMPVDPDFGLESAGTLPLADVPSLLSSSTTQLSDAPTLPGIDLVFPPTESESLDTAATSTRTPVTAIPDLDLNLPSASPEPAEAAQRALEEALSNPTLVGAVGAVGDVDSPRLGSNTDQATVPLIDFDLSGADAALTGRRTETQVGSPVASQMATKLDLARGYLDLGVKDGARELLEEVMKDGTREQRQQAVELIKLVDA